MSFQFGSRFSNGFKGSFKSNKKSYLASFTALILSFLFFVNIDTPSTGPTEVDFYSFAVEGGRLVATTKSVPVTID